MNQGELDVVKQEMARVNHKPESRLPEEISTTLDMQMISP